LFGGMMSGLFGSRSEWNLEQKAALQGAPFFAGRKAVAPAPGCGQQIGQMRG
jgi:hypothetical protein